MEKKTIYPLKPSDFNFPSLLPWLRYVLNVSSPSNRTSLTVTIPSPPNEKDFLLLTAKFAKKYTQNQFTQYNCIFNKQFWQQNLATSKFLTKCLLMTASFISSRKQYESFTLKHHCYYHQFLQRWGYGQRNLQGNLLKIIIWQ